MSLKNNLDPAYNVLLALPQELTSTWTNLGDPVYCGDTTNLTLFIRIQKGTSENIQLKMQGYISNPQLDGTVYEMPLKVVRSDKTLVNAHFVEFTVDANINYIYDFDVTALTHCRFQVRSLIPGSEPGSIVSTTMLKV